MALLRRLAVLPPDEPSRPGLRTRAIEAWLPLARHLFETPTFYYKTGVVFLAWLAGHQRHFRMVGGLESARSVPHLTRLFRLADAAGLLPDPDLAATRMRAWLTVQGAA